MRSRSFSWRSRAISAAWSADIGVACVVGRRAADLLKSATGSGACTRDGSDGNDLLMPKAKLPSLNRYSDGFLPPSCHQFGRRIAPV